MKKFVFKVVFYLAFCLTVAVIPAYLIDPYNVFHWDNIRNNGVEPNKNYIKTKYILNNPEKFEGFLFGSSRVGVIHVENISDEKIYNMTYSLGTPKEHLETLRTFVENNVKVQVVYLGVDSYSYTENPEGHYSQQLRCPYQQLDLPNLIHLYIDPRIVGQCMSTILGDNEIDGADVFYKYGWWCDYDRTTSMDWSRAEAFVGGSYLLDETLQDIQEIKDLCDENDIELVVFTNPMYELTYKKSIEMNYLEFLRRLAEITDYYNFSGINEITVNTDYW